VPVAVAVSAVVGLALGLAGPVSAALPQHSAVVSADPANNTPNVITDGGEVIKILQLGDIVYAGGRFTSVAPPRSTAGEPRSNLFAFTASRGALLPASGPGAFAPVINGEVVGLATDGTSLFVAGRFTSVNGVARRGLVKLDPATGAVVTAFNARLSGHVQDVQYLTLPDGTPRLLVGGRFSQKLAALDPTTGADTGYITAGISGAVADNAGEVDVYRFAVNPARTRLVAIGNFTTAGGAAHHRALMLDLGAASSTVSAWNYTPLQRMCRAASLPAYLRDVDFSPDGSYFVLVATGFIPATPAHVGTSICDAAARFETATLEPAKPTWINYTGGDTLHSVAITGAAVYVGDHQRFMDNPLDNATPTPVSREGLAALTPATGKALAWNPGRARGVGAKELYPTSAGLWLGHDTNLVAGEQRRRLAFFPLP